MENFQKNKVIGIVFANYLKNKLGKQYEVTDPKKKFVPDVDLILTCKQEDLFLQLKQVIKWRKTYKDIPKGVKKALEFDGGLFKEEIQKAESTYLKRGDDISDRILILHSGLDYFIPSDVLLVDRNEFMGSNFKGIYIVSPKEDIYGESGAEPQDEFVYDIKPVSKFSQFKKI